VVAVAAVQVLLLAVVVLVDYVTLMLIHFLV
jgi:hypothetical protein